MKIWMKSVLGALLVLGLCGCSLFREYEEYESDITLDQLQGLMSRSSDPTGLYHHAHSYVQKQISRVIGIFWDDEYVVEVKFKRPNSWRTITYEDNQPMNGVFYNGQQAWLVDYHSKIKKELTGKPLERIRNMLKLLQPDSTFSSTFEKVRLSQVRIDGVEYYKVVGSNPDQEPITIYVGKYSGLPKRLVTREKIAGMTVDYQSVMDSYAMYDHVVIANQSTVTVDASTQIFRVVQYRLNVDIDDSEFLPPSF